MLIRRLFRFVVGVIVVGGLTMLGFTIAGHAPNMRTDTANHFGHDLINGRGLNDNKNTAKLAIDFTFIGSAIAGVAFAVGATKI